MKKMLFRSCIELTNHRVTSKMLRRFSRSKLSKPLIKPFVATFQLNEAEMDKALREYQHLHDLFIRKLKPGVRVIDKDHQTMVSPVDGECAQSGNLNDQTRFHVKGQTYNIEEMLGAEDSARPYHNGYYFILYLSPSHYHRIHSPVDGTIIRQWKLGNLSYPVNNVGLRYGKQPLSRNYRVITEVDVDGKKLAIVKVGAMNINTIELTHEGKHLQKGEEMAYFSFGSTVVLLVEHGLISNINLESKEVLVGQKLAQLVRRGIPS